MKIEGEALTVALAQAVMSAFKPEAMTDVFRESLRYYIFEQTKDQYGSHPSPFSQAFQKALDTAARKVAEEFIAQPEQMDRIQVLLGQAFNATIADPEYKKKIVDKMARGLGGW